ncbi:type I restriction-modification system subunit M [Flavobacterium nackdongense]|uniref:site-specific DNA-methyltransferase (adenine-specific) n=1 Tax=Flavobacterium nackdongense TaxID=2547394 RepID=A0A4P6YIF9_9FLAO|nr:class I SAM-dependent DNA methyltransferase [Flavobacterium nackdongense]QBN20263.1 SAM-dependent DNA methyltransferase [Flavobacterium nackdongense]
MAIKKSELYSSLWASCDKLRGSMEPSQYKDYVLVLLFVKYVSDKYSNDPNALIFIPEGGSFKDMQSLKGQKDIGEKMDMAITKLAKENDLVNVIDVISFQDEEKLGKGKEMVDKLTGLITIFENPALDFSKNRAEGDDILGDAYEYLMRHFASESGKSKGEFYTPAEVSRVLAKVIEVNKGNKEKQTVYDPTCGSGSLLLKVAAEADNKVNLYGQEKETANASLARMNMILHNNPEAVIEKGQSTMSNPLHKNELGDLKTFDYIVANPPFSSKNWTDGFDPANDIYNRFEEGKIPPTKNGDYAFLLHIVKSLKSTGKAACILPHGVLFRGNVEAEIRKSLIQKGYIKGIIGLPANLFYGTGIPACVIVIDMENAENTKDLTDDEKGIFMVDASKGFLKDGNKNRLREQDIHKITDVFNKHTEIPKFSRLVSITEISDPKNDFNLNIPRYIDIQEVEDIQDIEAHLLGGIPNEDIDALKKYWDVYPSLKKELFVANKRPNYSDLKIAKEDIKQTIFNHPEFVAFSKEMDKLFNDWKTQYTIFLKQLTAGIKPKQVVHTISEAILTAYTGKALMDKYDVYQHVMNYWNETMQDDTYIIAVDGWKAEPYRILVKNKAGVETDKGWDCDLVPKTLVIDRYFLPEKTALQKLEADKEALAATQTELEEEHDTEEGIFSDFDKINKGTVQKRLKAIDTPKLKAENAEEITVLKTFLKLVENQALLTKKIKEAAAELDKKALAKYKILTIDEIKQLVVEDKWMTSIEKSVKSEMERISQRLTGRIKELAELYETPLPKQTKDVADLESKVTAHLQKMGFVWS